MIYYVSLLMIDDFEYSVIEKFDKLLRTIAKNPNKKITPKYVSNKLNISQLSATKLLSRSEEFGLVKLEYTIKCVNCGEKIKTNIIKNKSEYLCPRCKLTKVVNRIKNIYFYYLLLVS